MKKIMSLCVAMLIVFSFFGCAASVDDVPNDDFDNGDVNNDKSNYTFVSLHADYPFYYNVEDITNAAANIYIGTVKSVTFEIIDMKTGKIDNSSKSQSSSRMLYTVYTVSVKTSLKGDNPSEIKIRRIGGLVGHKESEQFKKMQDSGLLSKYDGIPVISDIDSIELDVDGEYLFCTNRYGGDFDSVINLTQFAHSMDSNEAKLILKSSK
jgi:hypothetical protein